MGSRGFTLFEIVLVVSIIAILLAIGIPSLLNSRKSGNEASAISGLRTINACNQQYKTRYGRFALSLANLSSARMIDQQIGSGQKSGYQFTYTGVQFTWSVTARPATTGVTGDRSFFVDQTGVLRGVAAGTATSASPPLQ